MPTKAQIRLAKRNQAILSASRVELEPRPRQGIAPAFSKYGYNTTNSPAKRVHQPTSRKRIKLVKISPGKSDDWA